jgi:proteasome beta subunit
MEYKKGTTTVGLVCKDGIVLAADKRGSLGHLAMHKRVDKILKVTDFIGITTAGMVGDAQKLYDYLKAELQLYLLEREESPTVEVASKLLSNILYEGRKSFLPYMSMFLLGGKSDDGGFKVFSLDSGGSSILDKYMCSGSGMELAYGVLDSTYKEGLSVSEGKVLAAKAINSALRRDVFTGDGIDVVIINNKGYQKINEEEVSKLLGK